jgi:hypothetical protein
MEIDKYKVAGVIRKLEQQDLIHEYFDVLDYGVDVVLSWYGIIEEWSDEDRKILKEHLLDTAYRDEVREIRRIVEEEDDWLLATIPDRELPSLKTLMIEHEIWKKEMTNKKKNENQKDSQIFCEVKK